MFRVRQLRFRRHLETLRERAGTQQQQRSWQHGLETWTGNPFYTHLGVPFPRFPPLSPPPGCRRNPRLGNNRCFRARVVPRKGPVQVSNLSSDCDLDDGGDAVNEAGGGKNSVIITPLKSIKKRNNYTYWGDFQTPLTGLVWSMRGRGKGGTGRGIHSYLAYDGPEKEIHSYLAYDGPEKRKTARVKTHRTTKSSGREAVNLFLTSERRTFRRSTRYAHKPGCGSLAVALLRARGPRAVTPPTPHACCCRYHRPGCRRRCL